MSSVQQGQPFFVCGYQPVAARSTSCIILFNDYPETPIITMRDDLNLAHFYKYYKINYQYHNR